VVTVLLIVLLIKISKLDLRVTVQQLRSVSWLSFAKLVLLTAVYVFLSTQKWRCVDAALRRPTDSAPSRTMSFALTSIGVALGQVLPVQFSMSAARTLGTYLHGRACRGTGGTLFEQSFDVLIVGFLAIASGATQTAARKLLPNEWEQQLTKVFAEHLQSWPITGKLRASVERVGMTSIAVNSSLAAVSRGESTKYSTVLLQLLALGPWGWHRYLRDSRIVQRVQSRLKVQRLEKLVRTELEHS
jgi:hypothetical protein